MLKSNELHRQFAATPSFVSSHSRPMPNEVFLSHSSANRPFVDDWMMFCVYMESRFGLATPT